MNERLSRRDFLRTSAAAAGGVALLGTGSISDAADSAGRVRIAVIGCGGMGNAHIGALQNLKNGGYPVDIVAVSDVYQPRLEAAASRTGGEPYKDYRKIIARKDVDAVSIATPDHWHSRMTIEAADSGKDVYCEKPMTHWRDLKEAQDVVTAVSRNKRVMQVGTQFMSSSIWEQANERIRAGAIGDLVHAQASDMRNGRIGLYDPNSNDGQADPNTNLDWDMWLGPAKKVPWHPGRFFAFRSFWDYSGGCGTDFLPHLLTPLVRTMGLELPKRVTATGGRYAWKDGAEIPDIFTITMEYPNGPSVLLMASLANNSGIPMVVRGHRGTINLELTSATIEAQRAVGNEAETEQITAERGWSLEEHFRDFLDCVKSRRKPRSNEVFGYRVMTALHMAIHSFRQDKVMEFDPSKGEARAV
ncbi:MAG: Gfo/Idh/MocA family oxidoreductase [Armatimonadetes bacterium]|nr:Gfo/Idh/MocA family oxidoreductase [Armatimonadota bacterium]